MIGVAKADSTVEFGLLEYAVRNVLNRTAPRRFGVLDPLKLVIDNYPEGQVEQVEAVNNPEDPVGRHPRGAVLAGAVDRARGLRRGAAAQVLPPLAGPRGAAARRVLRHLHERR